MPEKIDLSIITPMMNESLSLDLYFQQLLPILQATGLEWEIICIDDGSVDDTAERLRIWHKREPRIIMLRFSRNFGKEAAVTAGIDYCRGAAAILLDADLQDPPELIPKMLEHWRAGYQVVLAKRSARREDSFIKRATAKAFYHLMKRIAESSIPENVGDFRLIDRKVIEAVKAMPERVRFMKGILSWPGFNITTVEYERPARSAGVSAWSPIKLLRLALDGIFSFSNVPLKVWTFVGVTISFFSLCYALFLIIRTLIFGIDVPGYASLSTIILFMGGIQLISLGVIGEYISRIYLETKRRPIYIVSEHLKDQL